MIHMHFQSSDHVNGDVEHLQGVHNAMNQRAMFSVRRYLWESVVPHKVGNLNQ